MTTRTNIRSAIKALCESMEGIITVYAGRRRSIPESALPAICVYVEQEEKQRARMGTAPEYERRLTVACEIHVQGNSAEDVEDDLDLYCAQREAVLMADETLGGLLVSTTFSDDEYEIDEEKRRPAGVAVCRDQLFYREKVPPVITVSGAGSAAVNGVHSFSGTAGERISWQIEADFVYSIQYSTADSEWQVVGFIGPPAGVVLYSTGSTAVYPPKTGWQVVSGEADPPSLSY